MPLGLVRKLFAKPEVQAMLKQSAKSTPMAVDVSADGMRKKSKALARGTGVTYSGVKTSSQGLLTGAKTEKKTLLGS
jgi:hypothetical protein